MIRTTHKSGFTLIELLVSIAVFLILLVMMLEFLSGTQQIWKSTSGRGDVYVESKAALDLIASLLRETNYAKFQKEVSGSPVDKSYPVNIIKNASSGDTIHFLARSANSYGFDSDNELYFFTIGLAGNDLQIRGIPAAANDKLSKNYQAAIDGTWTGFITEDEMPFKDASPRTVIERVTGLDFYPLYRNSDGSLVANGTPQDKIPAALLVQIRMLDKNNFELYSDSATPTAVKDKILEGNEMTFSRIIYFDNRDYTVE